MIIIWNRVGESYYGYEFYNDVIDDYKYILI